jgi:hypothetical protein
MRRPTALSVALGSGKIAACPCIRDSGIRYRAWFPHPEAQARYRFSRGCSTGLVLSVEYLRRVESRSDGGHAWEPVYLLIRAQLQAIILGWVYWFTIRIMLQNKFNSPLNTDATRRSA